MISTKVALIGNPNVGKSTLFNRLTGLKQRVGNYPGTTVDKRIGFFTENGQSIQLYDFPGTYSLYPKAADEEVVFDILSNPEHPDFPDKVFVVGHPLRIKRSLLLFKQVQDLGIPVKFVLNMMDEAEREQISIRIQKLSEILNTQVIPTNARTGEGLDQIKESISTDFESKPSPFEIPLLYVNPVKEIREKLKLKSDYLAFQYAAQPNILHLTAEEKSTIENIRKQNHMVPARMQIAETLYRYDEIDAIVEQVESSSGEQKRSFSEKLDNVLTHGFWGYIIFFGLLFLMFQAIYSWAEVPMDAIDSLFAMLQSQAQGILGDGPLSSLISDGIIPGIGGVVIFIPQISILIFFLLLLEESGYMSRVVFLMDKWMKPFGLSGKSVVPLMSSVACAIPGIMAARNIENTRERLLTVLVAPFMTCSARLPVYASTLR